MARTTAARPAPKRTARDAKPAAATKTPAPAPQPAAELTKKQLIERVAARTGSRKKAAREVIEAALGEIALALSRGEGLNLAPLGKAKVNRHIERGTREVVVLKLRLTAKADATGPGPEGLAEPED